MPQPEGEGVRVGIVGCGPGTHGEVWARMMAGPDAARFAMTPVWLYDADPESARALAAECGATAVSTPAEAGVGVDGVLITELLPARYLELARPFLEAGQRVFFNRPFAGSVADARQICRLAEAHGAGVYSASALYHTEAGAAARESLAEWGAIRLFNMTGPTDHIAFYLPHAIAGLMSVLGTGISMVRTLSMERHGGARELTGVPVVVYAEYGEDSPVGPARGTLQMVGPGAEWYAFVLKLFGAKADAQEIRFAATYDLLLGEMARFFRTGEEPIPHPVLLEKTAVFYAALESAARGGEAVSIAETLG